MSVVGKMTISIAELLEDGDVRMESDLLKSAVMGGESNGLGLGEAPTCALPEVGFRSCSKTVVEMLVGDSMV